MQCTFSIKQRLSQPENLKLTGDLLGDTPALTRAQLAKELCRKLDLRDPKGDWRIGTTAKALRDLEAQGFCQLPKPTVEGARPWNPTRLHRSIPAARAVPKAVEEVQGLSLVEVEDREQLQICRAKKSSGREEAKAETLRWNLVGKLESHPERLATPGSEFCVVVREDGTKRKQ